MSSIKFYQPTSLQTPLTTGLNSLAPGNSALSTAYDNTSALDMWANFELALSYSTNVPSIGTAVANLYLLPSIDGTNYPVNSTPVTGTASSSSTTVTATTGIFTSAMVGWTISNTPATASGTASSSSTTVTATSSIFTSAMVGWTITGAGLSVTIVAFTSGTQVSVNTAPSWSSTAIFVTSGSQTVTISGVISTTQVIVNAAPSPAFSSSAIVVNNLPQKTLLVSIFESRVPSSSGTLERLNSPGVPIPPGKFKLLLVNTGNVSFASANNVLSMQPYQMQSV